MTLRGALTAMAALLLLHANPALAYRPFDGTDADVARAGETEIEFGPVQWLREGGRRFLQAPAAIANFGLRGDRELVIEGRREVAIDREAGEPRDAVVDDAVSLKHVVRRGVLQDAAGPSVATEYSLLLPEVHGAGGAGLSAAGIISQRSELGTVHLNGQLAWTREHEADVFVGVILEGPYAWAVRPVAELFTERAGGESRITSQLVGAIWRAGEDLSFDVGVRSAHAGSDSIREVRLGLTWSFSLRE